jgi:hypothetical protein
VVADDASSATRAVGGPGDHLSTAAWQSPQTLPLALLRVDQITFEGQTRTMPRLHTRGDCPQPRLFSGERAERGPVTAVDRCHVFERWLHPVSVRPLTPSAASGAVPVPACGTCLLEGAPE